MHMVFSSNGDDNRILYATSPNGFDWTQHVMSLFDDLVGAGE